MSHNRAVLYSNGIADFHRRFLVRRGTPAEISIPVRRDHVGDVLASLNIYGRVTLKRPPSFRPANEAAGTLALDPANVLEQLATTLSGAKVQVDKGGGTVTGTLVGLHTEQAATGGERVHPKFLVVQAEDGLRKVPLADLQRLRFEDADVRAELDKALRRNFQQIKPHSTFIELALETDEEETEAVIQYTLPAAAWKISYRLRQATDGPCEFQAFAVVDNNTDEDWNEFLIAVVTGEPITFSTDLAESKTPRRKHVSVVREEALGAVDVDEIAYSFPQEEGAAVMMGAPQEAAPASLHRMVRRASVMADDRAYAAGTARTDDAAAREVGDFSLFETTTPVSIGANRSAILPVFQTTLKHAKLVLHYKAENHAERPFRAVQFQNETPHSLGRGVCTVFQEGTFMGSCVMPATPPAGEALLPHALETSVRVRRDERRRQRQQTGLRLSEGVCHQSFHESQTVEYRIKSSRSEPQRLVLDHDFLLDEPQLQVMLRRPAAADVPVTPTESLAGGVRIQIDLAPQDELALVLVESRVSLSSIELINVRQDRIDTQWIEENIVVANGPLADHPAVRECLSIQRRLDAKQDEIRVALQEIERRTARQERLRKNLATGGHDEQTSQWKTDLGAAEQKIVELEDRVIPRLRDDERRIKDELRAAVIGLSAG